jgi:hypothetical protein
MLAYAIGQVDVGPMHWVLAILKIVFGPFLAPDWRAFSLAIGPALLVLLAHYVWVVRMEISFEDGSIALAQRTAEFNSARREGKRIFGGIPTRARRDPFPLPRRAPAEIAFLWKNLASTWSGFSPRTALLCAGAILLGCNWLAREPFGHGVLKFLGGLALVMAAYTLLLGPQYARQDLRADLSNADLIKAYPLPGWRIVLGEIMAPVAILGALLWLELLVVALALPEPRFPWMAPDLWIPMLVCLGVLAPFVSAMLLFVPNAGALLFPAWFHALRSRTAGVDAIGQRLIFTFGQILATVIALVPAAVTAALIYVATQWLLGNAAALAIATAAVIAIIAGELWVGIWWLGERFEKFDLTPYCTAADLTGCGLAHFCPKVSSCHEKTFSDPTSLPAGCIRRPGRRVPSRPRSPGGILRGDPPGVHERPGDRDSRGRAQQRARPDHREPVQGRLPHRRQGRLRRDHGEEGRRPLEPAGPHFGRRGQPRISDRGEVGRDDLRHHR